MGDVRLVCCACAGPLNRALSVRSGKKSAIGRTSDSSDGRGTPCRKAPFVTLPPPGARSTAVSADSPLAWTRTPDASRSRLGAYGAWGWRRISATRSAKNSGGEAALPGRSCRTRDRAAGSFSCVPISRTRPLCSPSCIGLVSRFTATGGRSRCRRRPIALLRYGIGSSRLATVSGPRRWWWSRR